MCRRREQHQLFEFGVGFYDKKNIIEGDINISYNCFSIRDDVPCPSIVAGTGQRGDHVVGGGYRRAGF